MPTPALSQAVIDETFARVEAELRAGFRPYGMTGSGDGAISVASKKAVADGFVSTISSFEGRITRLRGQGIEPDWGLYKPQRYQQPVARFELTPAPEPAPRAMTPSGEPRRVLFIPDRHNDPRHPHRLSATTWIARYGSEHRFDTVIDLGDDVTMDSVSRYDRNDTIKGRYKPGIKDDLDNLEAAERAFELGRDKDWKPKKVRCRGNHNQRLWDWENNHPESEGTHTQRYREILLQFGWREIGFGEIGYIEGVGYTHAPFNGMGKPMGGKTATHRAGGLLCTSLIHGHTHSFEVHNAAKLDPRDKVTVVQAGCALPDGELESYATHNPTGWSYGVVDCTVADGQIIDLAFVSMRKLRSVYSDDGG